MKDLSARVPYQFQGDSSNPRQAWRMCFSSSCAMLVEGISPGLLSQAPARRGRQVDDYYREILESLRVGDTTEYTAQLATLKHLLPGWRFEFRQNCTWLDVDDQLQRGIPVPMGILHHGPFTAPTGGGHWICCVGVENKRHVYHDPAGELDVRGGGYLSSAPTAGRAIRYSDEGLGPRWMVGGGKSGWAILAHRPR